MPTLTERIEAAARDMSIDGDKTHSAADVLLEFLSAHDLEIVYTGPDKAVQAATGDESAVITMLRNMCAAPVFWRSRAKALLSRIDACESPNPTARPEPES